MIIDKIILHKNNLNKLKESLEDENCILIENKYELKVYVLEEHSAYKLIINKAALSSDINNHWLNITPIEDIYDFIIVDSKTYRFPLSFLKETLDLDNRLIFKEAPNFILKIKRRKEAYKTIRNSEIEFYVDIANIFLFYKTKEVTSIKYILKDPNINNLITFIKETKEKIKLPEIFNYYLKMEQHKKE